MINRRSPGITSSETPFIAGKPPKDFLKPLICSAGVIAFATEATSGEIPGQRRPA